MATVQGPGEIKVYRLRLSKQLLLGAFGVLLIAVGSWALSEVWAWYAGGAMPHRPAREIVVILCVPLGTILIINAFRGFPRLRVTLQDITLDRGFGALTALDRAFRTISTLDTGLGAPSAKWNSLGPFEVSIVKKTLNWQLLKGSAQMVLTDKPGTPSQTKNFDIPDLFDTPIESLVTELNAARGEALGSREAKAP